VFTFFASVRMPLHEKTVAGPLHKSLRIFSSCATPKGLNVNSFM
jgi:hypothetical protein